MMRSGAQYALAEWVHCPNCHSANTRKCRHHDRYSYRQRYVCQACQQQLNDLRGTIYEGHHCPLRVWVACLYLMGLNFSNEQIAAQLDLRVNETQAMIGELRQRVVVKKPVGQA